MTAQQQPRSPSQGWPSAEFEQAATWLAGELARYVAASEAGQGPVVDLRPLTEVLERLDAERLIDEGGLDFAGFTRFVGEYLALSTRLHHPAYLAHQVAAPDFPSALGDMLHGAMNNPDAIYEMGPGASALEQAAINWMLRLVGWPPEPAGDGAAATPHAAGVLTHGGSLANLTALLAARAACAPDAWERGVPRDLVLLAPPGAHYSVARAASIMGLGSGAIVTAPVDEREVIVPDALPRVLAGLRERGLRCMAFVANACATATGLYDPLAEIGALCREHGLWLHVDGCHGASALLAPELRHLLRGVEPAPSRTRSASGERAGARVAIAGAPSARRIRAVDNLSCASNCRDPRPLRQILAHDELSRGRIRRASRLRRRILPGDRTSCGRIRRSRRAATTRAAANTISGRRNGSGALFHEARSMIGERRLRPCAPRALEAQRRPALPSLVSRTARSGRVLLEECR